MASKWDDIPRPFVKWAGGKAQLLPQLLPRVDEASPFDVYHEPFLGGGALFFALCRTGRLKGHRVCLSDSNGELINAYRLIRDDVDGLLARLEAHRARHDKAYYYRVRDSVPASDLDRAARMIYLNKTCFNGLYRVNRRGKFNVPMGRYENPVIADRANLEAVARALQHVELAVAPFETVLERAGKGDFVYFDPPYHPVSTTAFFTSYGRAGFDQRDQERLAGVVHQLSERGVKVLLSNSTAALILRLYAGYTTDEVPASRAINSKGARRGPVLEVLVRNY